MRTLFTILCFGIYFTALSQKETHQWFLQGGNRISVSPDGISNLPLLNGNPFSSSNFFSANTSVSDDLGNLLLASDGKTIIDKDLNIMPSIKNVVLKSSNDKVLAFKIPGSSRYYIFYSSVNDFGSNASSTLRYAIVDLSLNGGAGDVISYDQIIADNVSQGFTLAEGSDKQDGWLITHKSETDSFYTYKISSSGLSNIPVISRANSKLPGSEYIFRDLKTSHNGKIIAGISYKDFTTFFASTRYYTEVFYFDSNKGTLTSKVRTLRNYNDYFYSSQTLEFSPDDRLLYVGRMQRIFGLQPCGWGGGSVQQYNLCYNDSTDFTLYSMRVASDHNFCSPTLSWGRIQLGADKKIYMPRSGFTISGIVNPNRIGTSCNYLPDVYQLEKHNSAIISTPSFYHKEMAKAVGNNIIYKGGCYPEPLEFSITNDTINIISWDFGDVSSPGNFSNIKIPQHNFSKPGLYTVKAGLYNSTNQLIETITELVEVKDPGRRLLADYPRDTVFCEGGRLKLKLNVVNGIFHWSVNNQFGNNSIGVSDSYEITSSGTYHVQMRQNDCDGCIVKDSIKVTVLPSPYVNLGNDKVVCEGDSVQLSFYDDKADYLWSTGSTDKFIWVKEANTFWVSAEFNKNGCPQSDTIIITKVPGTKFSFPNDTTLCSGQTLLLNPGVPNANFIWQDNVFKQSHLVTKAGTYWARAFNSSGCVHSDTIKVSYIDASAISLGRDTSVCENGKLLLNPNVTEKKLLKCY